MPEDLGGLAAEGQENQERVPNEIYNVADMQMQEEAEHRQAKPATHPQSWFPAGPLSRCGRKKALQEQQVAQLTAATEQQFAI